MEEIEYIECDCLNPDHAVRFSILRDEMFPPEILINLHLNHYLPFHQRIFAAIKFVFGIKEATHYDVVELSKDQINRLYILTHQARVSIQKWEDKQNDSSTK
jgi:hypothetical protein